MIELVVWLVIVGVCLYLVETGIPMTYPVVIDRHKNPSVLSTRL
jgi:hypothetical protein